MAIPAPALHAGLALLALAATLTPASAQTRLFAEVSATARHTTDIDAVFHDASDWRNVDGPGPFARISAIADSDGQDQVYHGYARSWAQVAAGGIHLYAHSMSVASALDNRHTTGSGRASALVDDHFGLNVPTAPQGAVYTATVQVRVQGSAYAAALPSHPITTSSSQVAAFSSWQSWVRVSQGQNGPVLAEHRAGEDCDSRRSTPCSSWGSSGVQTFSFQIVNGGPLLMLRLGAGLMAGTSNYLLEPLFMHSESGADMSHTVAWGGVLSLRDAQGALVSDYSLFSATSGFDYRHAYAAAVPETPAAVLLALGLGALWSRRRLAEGALRRG